MIPALKLSPAPMVLTGLIMSVSKCSDNLPVYRFTPFAPCVEMNRSQ